MAVLTTLRDYLAGAVAKAVGAYAPGSGFTPPMWWPIGWWQGGYRIPAGGPNSAAEACVAAISQTVASMPLQHWRMLSNGGMELIKTSPAAKVLRKPNRYQSRADFILNLLRHELYDGNGVAVAERKAGNIVGLHLVPSASATPHVAPNGDVFYSVQSKNYLMPSSPVDGMENYWPAEDVLHVRMQTPRHPLIGESPIVAAALAVEAGNAIAGHMANFFSNMTRPSGYLRSPKLIKPEVAEALRAKWEEAYSKENSGRIAVLMDGLEWQGMSITSVDAQLIQSYKMTVADVARVFRVPLSIIGESGGQTYATTEALIRHWLSTGLGFVVEHLELALDALFDLPPDEFIAFDVESLLRADFAARIDALTKGITGGLFAPNEARAKEGLAAAKDGDEPRLQAQVVPLSFASKTTDPAAPTAPTAPTSPSAPVKPPEDPEDEDEEDEDPDAEPDEEKAKRPTRADYLATLRRFRDAA